MGIRIRYGMIGAEVGLVVISKQDARVFLMHPMFGFMAALDRSFSFIYD